MAYYAMQQIKVVLAAVLYLTSFVMIALTRTFVSDPPLLSIAVPATIMMLSGLWGLRAFAGVWSVVNFHRVSPPTGPVCDDDPSEPPAQAS